MIRYCYICQCCTCALMLGSIWSKQHKLDTYIVSIKFKLANIWSFKHLEMLQTSQNSENRIKATLESTDLTAGSKNMPLMREME